MADEFQNNGGNYEQNPQNTTPDFNQTPDSFATASGDFSNPATPDVNQDFTNSTPNVDQIQDFTANNSNSYSNPIPDIEPAPQPTTVDPGLDNPAAPNTFEEKKTGNRTFMIAAIAGVVVLLILAVILVIANLNTGNNNSDTPAVVENTTDTTTEQPAEETPVDNTRTGGDNTIASNSRIFNETTIPTDWLLQKFRAPVIDQDGNCINVSICGENADEDGDGAENIDEYNFQLDPLVADLDKDGISDGDELFVYYTDPSEDDSDNDGFKDGEETANCYDPRNVSVRFSADSLSTIETNISLQNLHEPTITTLTDAGASISDAETKGTNTIQCDTSAADSSSATDSSTDAADIPESSDTVTDTTTDLVDDGTL